MSTHTISIYPTQQVAELNGSLVFVLNIVPVPGKPSSNPICVLGSQFSPLAHASIHGYTRLRIWGSCSVPVEATSNICVICHFLSFKEPRKATSTDDQFFPPITKGRASDSIADKPHLRFSRFPLRYIRNRSRTCGNNRSYGDNEHK